MLIICVSCFTDIVCTERSILFREIWENFRHLLRFLTPIRKKNIAKKAPLGKIRIKKAPTWRKVDPDLCACVLWTWICFYITRF